MVIICVTSDADTYLIYELIVRVLHSRQVLGKSSSGATAYVEPSDAIEPNNERVRALVAADEEEERILSELNTLVTQNLNRIRQLMKDVTAIDLLSARAAYSSWLESPRPCVTIADEEEEEAVVEEEDKEYDDENMLIDVSSTCHPLILARVLPPLPDTAFWPDERRQRLGLDVKADAGWAGGDRGNVISEAAARSMVVVGDQSSEDEGLQSAQKLPEEEEEEEPVRFDLRIPRKTRTVVITGPNAGGKTAALKTLGLCSVMLSRGIWPPAAHGSTPLIPYFDSVLADIGEAQSLQQNLSTFSGHMLRLNGILWTAEDNAAHGRASLVLLDELGSGTDPVEGSALATSTLRYLASPPAVSLRTKAPKAKATLTVVTTHFTQLKELADQCIGDEASYSSTEEGQACYRRVLNASPEFCEESLRSTYKLRWGVAGNSYAIALAKRIGLDANVVKFAEAIRADSQVSRAGSKRLSIAEHLRRRKEEAHREYEAAVAIRRDAARIRSEIDREHAGLAEREAALTRFFEAESENHAAEEKNALRAGIDDAATIAEVDALIAEANRVVRECQEGIASVNAKLGRENIDDDDEYDNMEDWAAMGSLLRAALPEDSIHSKRTHL